MLHNHEGKHHKQEEHPGDGATDTNNYLDHNKQAEEDKAVIDKIIGDLIEAKVCYFYQI